MTASRFRLIIRFVGLRDLLARVGRHQSKITSQRSHAPEYVLVLADARYPELRRWRCVAAPAVQPASEDL